MRMTSAPALHAICNAIIGARYTAQKFATLEGGGKDIVMKATHAHTYAHEHMHIPVNVCTCHICRLAQSEVMVD